MYPPRLLIASLFIGVFLFFYHLQRKKLRILETLVREGIATKNGKILIDGEKLSGIVDGLNVASLIVKRRRYERKIKKV